jgi:surfeit locus 1 family protein
MGRFRHDRTVLVDALTELGPGFWVVTPLESPEGTILINRGFVPPDRKQAYAQPVGPVTVTGLLRMSEPGGRFLRPNRPAANLWYSRDVQAIARDRHLGKVAPYFIDAGAGTRASYPVGGLTVVQFRNAHLLYALIWLALSSLCLAAAGLLFRDRPAPPGESSPGSIGT